MLALRDGLASVCLNHRRSTRTRRAGLIREQRRCSLSDGALRCDAARDLRRRACAPLASFQVVPPVGHGNASAQWLRLAGIVRQAGVGCALVRASLRPTRNQGRSDRTSWAPRSVSVCLWVPSKCVAIKRSGFCRSRARTRSESAVSVKRIGRSKGFQSV